MSSLFTQVRRWKENSNQRNINFQLWINKKVVYYFKCRLCDADYVGFTSRHLHKHVEEHSNGQLRKEWAWKGSGDHYKQFQNFKKCQSKLDCLIFEMLLFVNLKQNGTNRVTRSTQSYLFYNFTLTIFCRFYRFYHFSVPIIIHAVVFCIVSVCKYFRVSKSVSH